MAHIKLDDVTKTYGGNRALRGLSLDIPDGQFFVLLGPTGAGKTTTLRLIAGLDQPTSGTISIGEVNVAGWSAAERDVALVFQYYSLYPRYTVRQNLAFPLRSKVRNHTEAEISERIDRAAKTLRIEHLLDRKTDRLSGGEMQRVSIGRAIVREPRAFRATRVDGLGTFAVEEQAIVVTPLRAQPPEPSYPLPWVQRLVRYVA